MCFHKNYNKQVRLYSTNKKGLQDITKLLLEFSIDSEIVGGFGAARNVYAIVIKASMNRFSKKIGFGLARKQEKLLNLIRNSP